MSLHDVDDFHGAVREAVRVLRDDGQLCVAVVHPFATAQDPRSLHTPSFEVTHPYAEPRRFEDHLERNGLSMTFVSVHRPLSAYTRALSANGMVIGELSEGGEGLVPWLLVFRAQRAPAAGGLTSG